MAKKKKVVKVYTEKDGILSDWIRCLAADEDKVWIGTEKGLSALDKKTGKINNFTYRLEELPKALEETANPPEGFIKGAVEFD